MENKNFQLIVALYRASKQSLQENSESSFSFEGILTKELQGAILCVQEMLKTQNGRYGGFEDPYFLEGATENQIISFSYELPQNDYGNFYQDVYQLIQKRRTLSFGVFSGNYYVINLDFCSVSDNINNYPEMVKLSKICSFIEFLKIIEDETDSADTDYPEVTFILHSAMYGQQLKIDTSLNGDVFKQVNTDYFDFSYVKDLMFSGNSNAHIEEKKSIMKAVIAKIIYFHSGEELSKLTILINNWGNIEQGYKNNLDAYLTNFSFDKVVLEITNEKIKLITAISNVLNDSLGKILATPLSFGVLLGAIQINKPFVYIITAVMLIIYGLTISGTLNKQNMYIESLAESANKLFLEKKLNAHGEVLKEIISVQDSIKNESKKTSNIISMYHVFAWLPLTLLIFYISID